MKNSTASILILSFVMTIGVFTGLMTYTLSQFDSVKIKSEEIVKYNNTKVDIMHTMYSAARERLLGMLIMANIDDDFLLDELYMEFNKHGAVFASARNRFEKLNLTPQEKTILDQQGAIAKVSIPIQFQVISLIHNSERKKAIDLLNEKGIEAQNRSLQKLSELVTLQRKSSQNILNEIEQQYAESVHLILTWSILTVLLGSFLAYKVIFKIIRTEKQLSVSHAELEQTNQNLEFLVKERTNEIEQTLENLKSTQDMLVENEKMASLGGLVAGIAHEVNTPLGVGLTSSSLLREKVEHLQSLFDNQALTQSALAEFLHQAHEATVIVEENLYRANDLIASFKQLAVDQTCDQTFTFNIYDTLHSSLISLNHVLKKQNIQSILSCNEQLTLNSNAGSVSQVVTNLIMNASIHAFDDYTPNPTIEIKVTERSDNRLEIQFIDNGKGMAKEVLDKAFEPFFTTKRGQGGSGLGLHLVYNLVTRKLKGTISVQSELGKGTVFLVAIPTQLGIV
jgi:signal transduction histidine kinase